MKLVETAVFTDRVDATADFYERLLGSAPIHRGSGIAIFKAGDATVLIHEKYEPGPGDLPCENHIAFGTPDVDGTVAGLIAAGLIVEYPPKDYDWGRSAYLRDPAGRLIEIQQTE